MAAAKKKKVSAKKSSSKKKKTAIKKKSSSKKAAAKKSSTKKKKSTAKKSAKKSVKKKSTSKKTKKKKSAKKSMTKKKTVTKKASAKKVSKKKSAPSKKKATAKKKTATKISRKASAKKVSRKKIRSNSSSEVPSASEAKKVEVEILDDDSWESEGSSQKERVSQQKDKPKDHDSIEVHSRGVDNTTSDLKKHSGEKALKAEVVDKIPEPTKEETEEEYSHLPTSVTDGLGMYLAEIRKYPLLTKEQEQIIAKRYKEKGDPKDAEILVTSNLRFVVKVASEYAKFGAKLIDLIQEGNVGLMHAVKEFNPYKGVRLITYAVWWIRGYIQEYLMKQYSMVKIGTTANQRKLFYRLEKEKKKIEQEGLEPTVKLLSARLGVGDDDVKLMEKRMQGRDISLDAPVDASGSTRLLDFESSDDVSPDELLGHFEEIATLNNMVEELKPTLNEKENYILEERILSEDPKKLQEIGEEWGVTREAVRQMEARVIKKIKDKVLSVRG